MSKYIRNIDDDDNAFFDSDTEEDTEKNSEYMNKLALESDDEDDKLEKADIIYDIEEDTFEKNCLYRHAYADTIIEEDFEDDHTAIKDNIVPDNERTTKARLSKYERVRILGDRTQQLSGGAKALIIGTEHLNPQKIAEIELKNNVLPFILYRRLPNGNVERWKLSELKK